MKKVYYGVDESILITNSYILCFNYQNLFLKYGTNFISTKKAILKLYCFLLSYLIEKGFVTYIACQITLSK